MTRFKTLSSKIIHKNKFWEYKKDEFETPQGKKGEYFYLNGKGVVSIVPVLDDGRLVLVSQYRYLKDKMSIEFPSGGCEENFSVNENANKELLEETGYQTNEMSKIGEFEIINGLGKEVCHVFMATELEKITEPQPELNGEILEVICRRIDEFEEMIKRGDIWDGKTLAIWALAREHVLKIIKEQYGLQSN